jgi:hypothetical protein
MNAYIQAAYAYCKQLYEGAMTPTAAVNFNGQKATGLANGTASTDAATFGQLGGYCAVAGGWTVGGAVGFSAGVTMYSAVGFLGASVYSAGGTLQIINNGSQCFTVQTNAAGAGPHIHLFDAGNGGGRKYIRVTSNQLQVVNAAYNGTPLILDDAGNMWITGGFVASGNITAFSDERIKTNWGSVQPNYVDTLATLKSGTFDRTDMEGIGRQAGVGAQSLQKLLPEAVIANEDGRLSVAYGQAAMVSVVELAKELVALRARVAELERAK